MKKNLVACLVYKRNTSDDEIKFVTTKLTSWGWKVISPPLNFDDLKGPDVVVILVMLVGWSKCLFAKKLREKAIKAGLSIYYWDIDQLLLKQLGNLS